MLVLFHCSHRVVSSVSTYWPW